MKKRKEEILETIEANRGKIRGFGVKKLGIFGSFARDEAVADSDLDFIVEFEKKTFDSYMDLKFFLEDLFDCRVDLVLSDKIKPRIKTPILKATIYAQGF